MSMLSGVGMVAASLLLGFASIVHATGNDANGKSRPGINHADTAAAVMPPPRQPPVGHRQPRIGDLPPASLSHFELELRREDQLIDQKIIICRGC
jgi:hypothetical protein